MHAGQRIISKEIDGFNMILNLDDGGISRALYQDGYRELAFMQILKETVKPGMICIDLGANIGFTTLPMLRGTGPSGHVYAIEPDPRSYALLRANIEQNQYSNCDFTQCIISSETTEKTFWLANAPNLSSVQRTKNSSKEMKIDSFTLEDFLLPREYPNLIKMDVEGHEVKILESGLEYFTKNDGTTHILLEVHPQFYNEDNDFANILQEYVDIGFKPKYVVSTPIYEPDLFREAGYEPTHRIDTDGYQRGIYENISSEDFIRFSCYEHEQPFFRNSREGARVATKIVRSCLFSREM